MSRTRACLYCLYPTAFSCCVASNIRDSSIFVHVIFGVCFRFSAVMLEVKAWTLAIWYICQWYTRLSKKLSPNSNTFVKMHTWWGEGCGGENQPVRLARISCSMIPSGLCCCGMHWMLVTFWECRKATTVRSAHIIADSSLTRVRNIPELGSVQQQARTTILITPAGSDTMVSCYCYLCLCAYVHTTFNIRLGPGMLRV